LCLALLASAIEAADRCVHPPDGLESGVRDELNLVRQDPPGYAFHLEDLRDSFRGKERKVAENTFLSTQEGVPALNEAIRALQATQPMGTLSEDPCLGASAAEHVLDTGPAGLVGHDSKNGGHFPARIKRHLTRYRQVGENIDYGSSTAREVVIQLLVDDGVPDRGHRRNILEPAFNAAGAACGPHQKYGIMCVIDFARE
jgi:uncharacterized protein YkwD